MTSARHDQSTAELRDLLQAGLSILSRNTACRSTQRIGPLSCAIASNSGALHHTLTRCLLPGGDGHDLAIGLLSGSQPPFRTPPPWNVPHTHARHLERLHIAADGALTAAFNPDFGHWMILDHHRREGLMWIADESLLPSWEQGSPFKTMINWFIAPSPLLMVHAGAVGTAAGGCLLVGQGGSGKSTTVAACFARGMPVCGDDLILVSEGDGGYRAWGLYDSLKYDPESSIVLPGALTSAPFAMSAAKRLIRYSDVRADGLAREMPLRAVLRAVITHGNRTAIVPEHPAAMLKSLAPPTVFLLRGHEEAALPKIGRMVRQLPCYRLELGTDPAAAATCLADWLDARPVPA